MESSTLSSSSLEHRSKRRMNSGFKDSIKESAFKDLKEVSVKKTSKEGVKRNRVLKHVDSPRPLDLEQLHEILNKLKEHSWNSNESCENYPTSVSNLMGLKEIVNIPLNDLKNRKSGQEIKHVRTISKSFEANMQQRAESACSMIEMALKKLEFYLSLEELRDLRRAISETKRNGDGSPRSMDSLRQNLTAKALQSSIVVTKSGSKSGHSSSLSSSPAALQKIKTNGSSYGDQAPVEKHAKNRRVHGLSKEASGKGESNTKSPGLQKQQHDLKNRSSSSINSNETKRSQMKHEIRQSPRKSCKKNQMILKDLSEKEPETVVPQQNNPTSHQILLAESQIFTKTHQEIGLILKTEDPNDRYMTGMLLEQDFLAILEQLKSTEPSNPQKLHQKLFYDLVNEFLVQKMQFLGYSFQLKSSCFSSQHLCKEICSEIECLQNSREKNTSDHKNSIFLYDLLRRSKDWDRFESVVVLIVLELEILMLEDLVDEIVSSETAAVLVAKLRSHRKRPLHKWRI